MDILRNIFGVLSSGLIRLLVSVGILAAAYFFIVKPVLKTTTDAIKTTNDSFQKSFGENGLNDLHKTFEDVNKQVERQVRRSFHTAKQDGHPKKLVRCVQHAHGDVHRIQRCTVKF
jgi:hypothetical protein